MSKNKVERTEGSHVVTMKTDTNGIPKGSAVVISGDYTIAALTDQDVFAQGVALDIAPSGVISAIPVLLAGPVLRVVAGDTIVAGELVSGDAAVPGEWIVDVSDPAGFALEGANDQDEVDICFTGEQH